MKRELKDGFAFDNVLFVVINSIKWEIVGKRGGMWLLRRSLTSEDSQSIVWTPRGVCESPRNSVMSYKIIIPTL